MAKSVLESRSNGSIHEHCHGSSKVNKRGRVSYVHSHVLSFLTLTILVSTWNYPQIATMSIGRSHLIRTSNTFSRLANLRLCLIGITSLNSSISLAL